jgi:hypothetical protein
MNHKITIITFLFFLSSCMPLRYLPHHTVYHYYNYKVYNNPIMINGENYVESIRTTQPNSTEREKMYLKYADYQSNINNFNQLTNNGFILSFEPFSQGRLITFISHQPTEY